ncbi:MAG: DUF1501 domain-containing protein [Acidobacteria bacterium]|nr:DUF1501 domain-containing protein [Acidobacteriota bacterium]
MRKGEFEFCRNVEQPDPRLGEVGRRDFLYRFGKGLGSMALSSLLYRDGSLAANSNLGDSLAVKPSHFPAKAKSCIFLFMSGAPSQMDTFDPKPKLAELHGKPIVRKYGGLEKRIYVGSPFKFSRHGKSGMEISEIFPHLAGCADDIAVVRAMHTSSEAHTTATFFMNTGEAIPGSPSMGAWAAYGLGTENQNLPAFVVLPDTRGGVFGGAINWASGYLPAYYQGTLLNSVGDPIVDLKPPAGVTAQRQKKNIALLNELNESFLDAQPRNPHLLARMKNYELAFRMQTAVPSSLDMSQEPETIREMYGLNNKVSEPMARKCLMARRLVERGVRFVQVYCQGWDSHENIAGEHKKRGLETDKPIAALLKDLKQRGLLDQTLVVWGGEFGRTADNTMDFFRTGPGRDHNKDAMVMWLAGAGIKGGTVVGETDELGIKCVENVYHTHDLHATMLHLMGLDHMRLTYYHSGRFKRLTDLGGNMIKEILA